MRSGSSMQAMTHSVVPHLGQVSIGPPGDAFGYGVQQPGELGGSTDTPRLPPGGMPRYPWLEWAFAASFLIGLMSMVTFKPWRH